MIIVDVRVPALEKVYNFSVEEKAKVSDLIEEVLELIVQKEHLAFSGDMEKLTLYCTDRAVQCGQSCCLADYGINGGSELVLV